MAIGKSWLDHNHPTVFRWCSASSAQRGFLRHRHFAESAICHVRASANFIESRAAGGHCCSLIHGRRRRTTCAIATCQTLRNRCSIAAFGGQSDYITRDSDRWYLPCFVFGPDWNSITACARY